MNERADHLVSYLVRKNVLSLEEALKESHEELVYYALVDFDKQIELASYRAETPVIRSQLALAKDKKTILSEYINGADTDELYAHFERYGWTPPKSGDYSKWAASALGRYLGIKKRNEAYETNQEVQHQIIEWDYSAQRSLRDTIIDFYEKGIFSSADAQQFLFVMGQVDYDELKQRHSEEVLFAARQQGAVKLRHAISLIDRDKENLLHTQAVNTVLTVIGQSVSTIRSVSEVALEYAEKKVMPIDEARAQIDGLLSLGIEYVYGSHQEQ